MRMSRKREGGLKKGRRYGRSWKVLKKEGRDGRRWEDKAKSKGKEERRARPGEELLNPVAEGKFLLFELLPFDSLFSSSSSRRRPPRPSFPRPPRLLPRPLPCSVSIHWRSSSPLLRLSIRSISICCVRVVARGGAAVARSAGGISYSRIVPSDLPKELVEMHVYTPTSDSWKSLMWSCIRVLYSFVFSSITVCFPLFRSISF